MDDKKRSFEEFLNKSLLGSNLHFDECTTNSHTCDVNAFCQNTAGSHTCSCKAGYTGVGTTCSGKLENEAEKIPVTRRFVGFLLN